MVDAQESSLGFSTISLILISQSFSKTILGLTQNLRNYVSAAFPQGKAIASDRSKAVHVVRPNAKHVLSNCGNSGIAISQEGDATLTLYVVIVAMTNLCSVSAVYICGASFTQRLFIRRVF